VACFLRAERNKTPSDGKILLLDFVHRFYKELAPSLAQEEGYLLERDFRRTEAFWDQFCSRPSGYLVAFQGNV
jgi:hypothetical protein